MKRVMFRERRAVQLDSDEARLTLTEEGGHVAEMLHKQTEVNPLWTPEWPSIEPSRHSRTLHPEYGNGAEAKLLAGLLGHNICLDLFGAPDPEEAAAGILVHGEASVAPYDVLGTEREIVLRASLPKAQLTLDRKVSLANEGVTVFAETVHNTACTDCPIRWTQHLTIGEPFLERA